MTQSSDASKSIPSPGYHADLLLLEADPTIDLAALQRRVGVMVGGRWHDQAALQRDLEAAVAPR